MLSKQNSLSRYSSNDDYSFVTMLKQTKKKNFQYRMVEMKNEINHKNQILMNKLMEISMGRRQHSNQKQHRRLISLNHIVRKNENKRITQENEKFAKRLFFKKPFINVRHSEDDYSRHLQHKKRLIKLRKEDEHTFKFKQQSSPILLPPIKQQNKDISTGGQLRENKFANNPGSLHYSPKGEGKAELKGKKESIQAQSASKRSEKNRSLAHSSKKTAEPAKTAEDVKHKEEKQVENTKQTELSKKVEDAKSSESEKPLENSKEIENPKHLDPAQPSDTVKPVDTTKHPESAASALEPTAYALPSDRDGHPKSDSLSRASGQSTFYIKSLTFTHRP